jgi:type IX secretion system PorP/SprF family membrane protein
MKWTFALFFGWLFCVSLGAQDLHFTQFHQAPARLNPALCGVFSGDFRFTGHGRSQWASVPVPYETYGLNLDFKWPFQPLESGWLTGGVFLDVDQAGDSKMQLIQPGLALGYIQPIREGVFLSAGFQYRFANRSLQLDNLRFNDQYNGDLFDPSLPNGESLAGESYSFHSLATGINIRVQNQETRYRVDVGASAFHLNQPRTSFYQAADSRLPLLWNGYTAATIPVGLTMDLDLYGIFQQQGPHQELIFGALYRYHLNLNRDKEISLGIGSYYRHQDAVSPVLEVRYRSWQVAFSYDLNTSPFQVATGGRGGPELHVQYRWTRVQPPPVFKACPIF